VIKTWDDGFSADVCAEIIARFERDKRVKPDPQPDYSTRKFLNASLCADWADTNAYVLKRVNALTAEYFRQKGPLKDATHKEWSHDGFVVSRYDVGDACIMHVDGQNPVPPNNGLRLATLLFYLNDVADGGETWFPLQDLKIQPRRGLAVMFPVGYTHPHQVLKAQSARYILQTWITDPSLMVVSRAAPSRTR
jgi:hypothetical protein